MVIGPNGEQLGIKNIKDALTLATYAGFDLVLINPNANPQVCKIMDYNKFKEYCPTIFVLFAFSISSTGNGFTIY